MVVIDNLVNSNEESLRRVAELSGAPVAFHWVDLVDEPAVDAAFTEQPIAAIIHFAGLKASGNPSGSP